MMWMLPKGIPFKSELQFESVKDPTLNKYAIKGSVMDVWAGQIEDHFGGRESWDRSLDNAVNNIKEHFGVK
jgi:hypothetical protein